MQSGSEQPRVPFVDLAAQHAGIRDELAAATERVLRDADFILGRDVECFEEEFARYCGCEYGVGVDSGTSALELALRAYGVGPGDEVIVPANTFIATALAVSCTGATPVLAPGTMLLLGLVGLAHAYRHPRATPGAAASMENRP